MLRTYEGILEGDRVRWAGEKGADTDRPLRVHVAGLEEEPEKGPRGQKRADALAKLAESRASSTVDDPSAWQRQVRHDRPLPGRDR